MLLCCVVSGTFYFLTLITILSVRVRELLFYRIYPMWSFGGFLFGDYCQRVNNRTSQPTGIELKRYCRREKWPVFVWLFSRLNILWSNNYRVCSAERSRFKVIAKSEGWCTMSWWLYLVLLATENLHWDRYNNMSLSVTDTWYRAIR